MASNPSRVVGIFPTPVLHVPALLSEAQINALKGAFLPQAGLSNAKSSALVHTSILDPEDDGLLSELTALVTPRLVEFGQLIFGEALRWSVKEIWINVLEQGGQQTLHSHANSFVSGVVYLSACHPASTLVFLRGMGQPGFVFKNTHANSGTGPFNADKWVMPAVNAGDLVLFPSYLLHEVPTNQGGTRISLAFNAIPQRLDAWGYRVAFSTHSTD